MRFGLTAVQKRLIVLGALILLGVLCAADALFVPDGAVVSFLRATHLEWEKPRIFGLFHLCSLAICLLFALGAILLGRKLNSRHLDSILFGAGALLFLLELYKQLYYHTVLGNGHYNFGILPLQFCSYSLYLYLLIPLLREGRLKNTLCLFTALYQTMGGCIVMAYPMFYSQSSLCVHTMLWHTVMIMVGLLALRLRGYGRRYLREMLPAGGVFLVVFALATALNLGLTPFTEHSLQPLNLFYMSPHHPTNYIIIGDVRQAYGWIPSLVCYVLLFVTIGAHTVWGVGWLLRRLDKNSPEPD